MSAILIRDLKPGHYVVPAKARVASVDCFADVVIVEFEDGTATCPLSSTATVEVSP